MRGTLGAAGAGLARHDRRLLPEQRIHPGERRSPEGAGGLPRRPRLDQLGRDHAPPAGGAMTVEAARAVADAVLYEGYLLYPYRASAAKNRSRWQFGVLGPPAAASPAFAEDPRMAMRCLLPSALRPGSVTVHLRFLQLQTRQALDADCRPVASLRVGEQTVLTWDEAVEHELTFGVSLAPGKSDFPVLIPGGMDEEPLGDDGLIERRRWPLTVEVSVAVERDGALTRLSVEVANEHPDAVTSKDDAIR